MDRRNALCTLAAGLAGVPALSLQTKGAAPSESARLFPTNLPSREWRQFSAAGFSKPACGVIYRQIQPPRQGMALGGIDTGYMSLEADGTLGFCTVFNSIAPQRGPLALPLLGMSLGNQVWLLSSPRGTSGEYVWIPGRRVQTPSTIHYWGHYPVADLEYDMPGSPVSVGLRAWSPFLPGDSATSNTPGAVFEVHLHNLTDVPQQGRLAFMFPGPTQAEAQISTHSPRVKRTKPHIQWIAAAPTRTRAQRQQVRGEFSGLVVTSEAVKDIGYAIGVVGDVEVHVGGGLSGGSAAASQNIPEGEPGESPDKRGRVWAGIGSSLPEPQEDNFSGSVSVNFQLGPGEQKPVRFVLAWFAPMWIGEGPHTFTHMYAARFKGALDVAQFLSRDHESLLRRVLAWQEVIFR